MKYALIIAIVGLLSAPPAVFATATDRWIDQELVRLGDEQPDSATLERWSERLAEEPDNLRLRADYAILLTRAGQLEQALTAARRVLWQRYPAYFIDAMAQALAQEGRQKEALELLELGSREHPHHTGLIANRIRTLANHPDTLARAEQYATRLSDEQRQQQEVRAALGWLAQQQNRHALAAAHYAQARQLGEDHPWLFHQELAALQRIGLHQQALELAAQRREWLDDGDWVAVVGDHAAWLFRLALAEDEGRHWYDAAISAIEEHCNLAETLADEHAEQQRCESTRIRLMSERGAHRRATRHYRRNMAAGIPLDQEAHLAALGSYLALSNLRAAEQAATQIAPLPTEQRATLMMLSERPAAARVVLEEGRAEQPIWIWGAHSDRSHANHERLALEQEIARSFAWEGRLAESQEKLTPLHQAAPRHAGLRLQLAELYRWRGWPDRADQEYDVIEAMEPVSPALHRARFAAESDRRAWHAAGQHLDLVRQRTLPPAQPTGETQRWRTDTGPWFATGIRQGRGANSLDPTASRSLSSYAELYSSAWTRLDDSRVFVRHNQFQNRQRDARDRLTRIYLGATTGHRDRDLEVAWVMRPSQSGGAINLRADYRFNDHWRLDGHLQGDSDATPLRAASNDIDLRTAQLALTYAVEAGHQYRGQITGGEYSDGNRSSSIGLSGRQPLYRRSAHQWAAYQDISLFTNSDQDTPYYSPERALSMIARLGYEGRLYALMARRWSHRAQVGGGLLDEEGFGSSLIWQAEYGHQWQANRHFTIGVDAGISSREYSGDREQEVSIGAWLIWRWL